MKMKKSGLVVLLLAAWGASLAAPGSPAGGAPVTVNIESQPMEAALNAFAAQTGLQLLFHVDEIITPEMKADRVIGTLPAAAALKKLLNDSGLRYEFINARTVAIRAAEEKTAADGSGKGMRFAQLGQADTGESQQQAQATTEGDDQGEKVELEEVVVTGTHIRGLKDVPSPSYTFTREDIAKTGVSSVQELFSKLPQNFNELSPTTASGTGASRISTENTQGASSISLRGLGPEATLTLLNGRRRAGTVSGRIVDVSVIPLSVIERIDVVAGGNSAIYGADAVAGVVNIITRKEFTGAETQVYYGGAAAGGERLQASQVFGAHLDRGGFVVAYDYSRQWALDILDTGVARFPAISGFVPVSIQHDGDREGHTGFVAGHFDINDAVDVYGSALYSSSKNKAVFAAALPGIFDFFQQFDTDTDTFSIDLGARIELSDQWNVNVSADRSTVDSAEPFLFGPIGGPFGKAGMSANDATESALTAILDGQFRSFGTMKIHSAFGMERRKESYDSVDQGTGRRQSNDRDVNSAFAELNVPLVDPGLNRGLRSLELTLAARYDDFSDFGNSFNPQAGLLWSPAEKWMIRASYASTFRAPPLFVLGFEQDILLQSQPDPAAPGGESPVFYVTGGNPAIKAEEADTYTFGIDYDLAPTTRLSASYFSINFDGRIDEAASLGEILPNAEVFGSIIDRTPTEEQLRAFYSNVFFFDNFTDVPSFDPTTQNFLDEFPNIVLIDNRRQNIASEKVQGLDLKIDSTLLTALGEVSLGLNGAYYLDFERKVTSAAPPISQVGSPGKPVDFRLRANVGLRHGAWEGYLYANYTDSYKDTFALTPVTIESWTTFDLTLRFNSSRQFDKGLLSGLIATLSVDNLLDEDPPEFLSNDVGLGFDPANANAYGRFVSARLEKRW